MPDNYEQSAAKLLNYISDDQICMILSSRNPTTANKMILDCLIEKISCRKEILGLCKQLEIISTSQQLNTLISKMRSGMYRNCVMCYVANSMLCVAIYIQWNIYLFVAIYA